MSVCTALVIALATLFSYLHLVQTLRTEALEQLEKYVEERRQREQALFVLAEDTHVLLKKALEERIHDGGQEDPAALDFDALFERRPDGAIRNRLERFDGTKHPCGIVSEGVTVDDDLRRRVLAAYDTLAQYGPAYHVRFTNTYISIPEGAITLYWPDNPQWCERIGPRLSVVSAKPKPAPKSANAISAGESLWSSLRPENNPQRRTTWSGLYWEKVSKHWMTTISSPLDLDGRHVATISHDVLVKELMERTLQDHLPGAYNLIIRDDGMLIAHPVLMRGETSGPHALLNAGELPGTSDPQPGSLEQRAHLKSTFERVKNRRPGQVVLEDPEYGEYIAVTRLEGPGWNFVTVLPMSMVTRPAGRAARYVLIFGVVSLLLELAIMSWVLQVQIARPLKTLTQATDKVAAGDFQVGLDSSRHDELGRLAHAFRWMTGEVQRREEALRQANEGLEHRVEERTRELKETHRQLVGLARQAGMAEIATNVLHNVGNVLNSVHTSATLAKEQLTGMQLEKVDKVVNLLEEHQADLATFLSQNPRGRLIVPFLKQVAEQQRKERQGILSLLDDVSRYTEHIGTIVKVQQDYAGFPKLHESVHLTALLEDALRINEAALGRAEVKVDRHFAPLPSVLTDKHKVLMILVNLISNARHALEALPPSERLLLLRVDPPSEGRVRLSVIDNGVGIDPEMLTNIFQHGFTTREKGHGFGLHSSALAAQDLGGSLTARSEGRGHGAAFTLELPYQPGDEVA